MIGNWLEPLTTTWRLFTTYIFHMTSNTLYYTILLCSRRIILQLIVWVKFVFLVGLTICFIEPAELLLNIWNLKVHQAGLVEAKERVSEGQFLLAKQAQLPKQQVMISMI